MAAAGAAIEIVVSEAVDEQLHPSEHLDASYDPTSSNLGLHPDPSGDGELDESTPLLGNMKSSKSSESFLSAISDPFGSITPELLAEGDDLDKENNIIHLNNNPRWKKQLRIIVNNQPQNLPGTALRWFFTIVLLLSIVILVLGTEAQYAQYKLAIFLVNVFCVLVFSMEIALEFYVAPSWSSLNHFMTYIDLSATIPFYIEVLICLGSGQSLIDGTTAISGLAALRILRVFRVFRLLKLFERSDELLLLVKALQASSNGIVALLITLPLLVTFFGTLLYYAEQTNEYYENGKWYYYDDKSLSPFQSIPDAFWQIIVTLTTVGYGDVVPRTLAGRFVSVATMVVALFVMAYPLTIITMHYSNVVTQHENAIKRRQKRQQALQAGVQRDARGRSKSRERGLEVEYPDSPQDGPQVAAVGRDIVSIMRNRKEPSVDYSSLLDELHRTSTPSQVQLVEIKRDELDLSQVSVRVKVKSDEQFRKILQLLSQI
ncbi:uncharacterized protein BJ171DRAFT_528225, partial [Polychytrium aggregatum]|uniref:uncharacterized protein n=1 Tax=Polychytrium aggregatum TaxID=110093 RepID=UPI0022FE5596